MQNGPKAIRFSYRRIAQQGLLDRMMLCQNKIKQSIAENVEKVQLYTYTTPPLAPPMPHWPLSQPGSGAGLSPESHSGFCAVVMHLQEQTDKQSPHQVASSKCCCTAKSHHARTQYG